MSPSDGVSPSEAINVKVRRCTYLNISNIKKIIKINVDNCQGSLRCNGPMCKMKRIRADSWHFTEIFVSPSVNLAIRDADLEGEGGEDSGCGDGNIGGSNNTESL